MICGFICSRGGRLGFGGRRDVAGNEDVESEAVVFVIRFAQLAVAIDGGLQNVPAGLETRDVDPLAVERFVVDILPTGGEALVFAIIAAAVRGAAEVFVIIPQTEGLFSAADNEPSPGVVNRIADEVAIVVMAVTGTPLVQVRFFARFAKNEVTATDIGDGDIKAQQCPQSGSADAALCDGTVIGGKVPLFDRPSPGRAPANQSEIKRSSGRGPREGKS